MTPFSLFFEIIGMIVCMFAVFCLGVFLIAKAEDKYKGPY